MAAADENPVELVTWMIRGQWVTLALRAAVELGIFDETDEPRTAARLAARSSSDPATLARLLRVLVDLGLLEATDPRIGVDDILTVTPLGATLALGDPSGLRDLALMQTVLPNLASWQRLSEAVRRGGSVFEAANGVGPWQSLAENPDQEQIFNASMARRAGGQTASVLTACDLEGVGLLVDVGGGRGAMAGLLLRALPELEVVVAERPEVAAAADRAFAEAGLGDRGSGAGCDFFTSVPADGDVYVVANVLHDWDDDDAIRILRTVRSAMRPAARLWVVEQVLDAPERPFVGRRDLHLVDLHMLVMFGARERTAEEYDGLLRSSGFERGTLLAGTRSWNVIETRALP